MVYDEPLQLSPETSQRCVYLIEDAVEVAQCPQRSQDLNDRYSFLKANTRGIPQLPEEGVAERDAKREAREQEARERAKAYMRTSQHPK